MIYIKKFNNENDYLTYRDGISYLKPNVSFSVDSKAVHYNYPEIDTNGFDFVNLELPSGTIWAACNVGASKPSDSGLYFQWGDTQGYTVKQIGNGNGKKKFASDWSDYKFGKPNFSKYKTTGATLDLEDDAAHVHMGGDWHMPTPDQMQELIDNTATALTASNGVRGVTFVSKKNDSKSIFIPTAGYALNGLLYNSGYGNLWPSMLTIENIAKCQYLGPGSQDTSLYNNGWRYYGFSVRGVIG